MQRDCQFAPLRLWADCGSSCPPIRRTKSLWYTHVSRFMKFAFLLWVALWSVIDASIWATASWCLLGYFNILWFQCFWVFMLAHLVWNIPAIKYGSTQTNEDCLLYMRRESMSIGVAFILALGTSIIPTAVAILLLSMLERWTNLQTHWLHTWLCVTCALYIAAKASEKKRMTTYTRARTAQNAVGRSPFGRVIDV
jgi:hypothetical protein